MSTHRDLQTSREFKAEEVLGAHDFGDDITITDRGRWHHEPRTEDAGDRVYCTLIGDSNDETGTLCQFNVFFQPGSATVADSYEGDWHGGEKNQGEDE